MNSQVIIHFLMSTVSEQTSEWCEQMSKRMSKWPSTYIWVLVDLAHSAVEVATLFSTHPSVPDLPPHPPPPLPPTPPEPPLVSLLSSHSFFHFLLPILGPCGCWTIGNEVWLSLRDRFDFYASSTWKEDQIPDYTSITSSLNSLTRCQRPLALLE